MGVIETVIEARAKKLRAFSPARMWSAVVPWLMTWELYPILALAIFLRVYLWTMTQFDADQAVIYGLAHRAVVHGLIPITTNASSIGIMNPPATVYLLMLGAVFSANPYAGLIVVIILNVLAVFLTYIVVRRYFGRIAGAFSALFYAVALHTVFYGRFIWNQNMLAPFVLLFLLALLWGVMERRRGWLAPAVLLWGWMVQLHGSAIFLVVPLVIACILALQTLRWRDFFLAAGLLLVIYAPFILWEASTRFADISILMQNLHHSSTIDTQIWSFYLSYIRAFDFSPTAEAGSLGRILQPMLHWDYRFMLLLLLGSYLFALFALCQVKYQLLLFIPRDNIQRDGFLKTGKHSFLARLLSQWQTIQASPGRSALLLLLAWQIVPLLLLTRHSLDLFPYYILVLMPGPFILIGICAAQVIEWLQQMRVPWPGVRYAVPLLLTGLVIMQLIGTLAWLQDDAHGFHPNGNTYHSLGDLQRVLATVDHLASIRHVQHIYIDTETTTVDAFDYLAAQMQTPHTLLSSNTSHCLVLPDITHGSALILFGPTQQLDETFLTHFARATLISEPSYVGGPPFRLYLVQPLASAPDSQASFTRTLTPNKHQPGVLTWNDPSQSYSSTMRFFETGWENLQNLPSEEGTTYTYHLNARYSGEGLNGQTSSIDCNVTSLTPGEQLLIPFQLPTGSITAPTTLTLSGSSWITRPYTLHWGPLNFESIRTQSSAPVSFEAISGRNSLTI